MTELEPLGREYVICCTLEGELWTAKEEMRTHQKKHFALVSTDTLADALRLTNAFGVRLRDGHLKGRVIATMVHHCLRGRNLEAIEKLQREMLAEYQQILDRRAGKSKSPGLFDGVPDPRDGNYTKVAPRRRKQTKRPPCSFCTYPSRIDCQYRQPNGKVCQRPCCGVHATFVSGVGTVCKDHAEEVGRSA